MLELALRKEIIINKATCRIVSVGVFVAFISPGAFVRVPLPFSPVPITLQTFFVLLAGALLGRRLGLFTQTTYIALGALGKLLFIGFLPFIPGDLLKALAAGHIYLRLKARFRQIL